jgi:hypothetical protein
MATTLKDLYRFPGFRPLSWLRPHPLDTKGYILTLQRRQKKQYAHAVAKQFVDIDLVASTEYAILMQGMPTYTLNFNIVGLTARTVTP